jgi:hypothetical protein
MYDVDYETKDYGNAIKTIEKLILLTLNSKKTWLRFTWTSQFDKALQLINELNESSGKSDRRESYKMQILSQGKYQNAEISNLIDQIKILKSNYISLIYLYSKK